MNDQIDPRLSTLFSEYKAALPDPDASAGFMPGMWRRIESQERYSIGFTRLARSLITAAAAASMVMGALLAWPEPRAELSTSASYLEVLASVDNSDGLPDSEIVRPVERPR